MIQRCKHCGNMAACHMHHPSMRSAGNIDNVIPLCPRCHAWAHQEVKKATEAKLFDRQQQFSREREYHQTQDT